MSFALRFRRDLPPGVCVAVSLPELAEPPFPPALHPEEAEYAHLLPAARRAGFVGGRLALHAALDALGAGAGAPGDPILATPRGAPALPPGFIGSISHKRDIAVAIAARADAASRTTVGIDVETPRSLRGDVARHVLAPDERAALAGLQGDALSRELLFRFAAKEAVYKALDPWVGRFVSFQEARIETADGGERAVTLALARGEGPFGVTLHDASDDGLLLVVAWITDQRK